MWKPLVIMVAMALIFISALSAFAIAGLKNQNSPESAVNEAEASATAQQNHTAAPAGSASASASAQGTAQPGGTLDISTPDDIHYDKSELTVSAGAHVTIKYTNNSDIPHNIHFFNGSDDKAPSLGQTPIGPGPNDAETVSFTAPSSAGSYLFECDVHTTQMQGKLVVH